MKHNKFYALFMAIVMIMSTLVMPAHALYQDTMPTFDEVMDIVWVAIEMDHELETGNPNNTHGWWRDYNDYGDEYIAVVKQKIDAKMDFVKEYIYPIEGQYWDARTFASSALDAATTDTAFRKDHPFNNKGFLGGGLVTGKLDKTPDPEPTVSTGNQQGIYSDEVDLDALDPSKLGDFLDANPEYQDEVKDYLDEHPEYSQYVPQLETSSSIKFTDVAPDAWYAQAVYAVAEGGLMKGIGNDLFNPEGTLTNGEVAMVICRIFGWDTTPEANAHWAQTALDNTTSWTILNAQNKTALGINAVTERQFAIAAIVYVTRSMPEYAARLDSDIKMQWWSIDGTLATYMNPTMIGRVDNTRTVYPRKQIADKVWTPADIPDWDNISTVYNTRNEIINAYNADITHGVDASGTFDPEGTLTRAQLAQLLYNIGITTENSVKHVGGVGLAG